MLEFKQCIDTMVETTAGLHYTPRPYMQTETTIHHHHRFRFMNTVLLIKCLQFMSFYRSHSRHDSINERKALRSAWLFER